MELTKHATRAGLSTTSSCAETRVIFVSHVTFRYVWEPFSDTDEREASRKLAAGGRIQHTNINEVDSCTTV